MGALGTPAPTHTRAAGTRGDRSDRPQPGPRAQQVEAHSPCPPDRQLLGAGAGVRARSPRPALPALRLASARGSGSASAAPQPVGEGSGSGPLDPLGSPAPAALLTWRRPSPPAALPAAAGRRRRVGTGEAAEPLLAPAPPPPALRPLFIKLFCLVVRPVTRPRAGAPRLAGAWR